MAEENENEELAADRLQCSGFVRLPDYAYDRFCAGDVLEPLNIFLCILLLIFISVSVSDTWRSAGQSGLVI